MDVVGFRTALNVLLDDAAKNRAEDAAESWQALEKCIQINSQIDQDVAFAASILLASEDSLLQFLVKSLEQQGDFRHESTRCSYATLRILPLLALVGLCSACANHRTLLSGGLGNSSTLTSQ